MKCAVLALLVALAPAALAAPVQAACYGTGSFQRCSDNSGNSYSVQRFGDSTTMRGYNSQTGSTWTQNSRTLGNTTTHSGTSSDGGNWNMRQNSFGGITTYSGTDSDGNSFHQTCTQFGCN